MHPMLNIAIRAARNAGNVIARAFEHPDKIEAVQKGNNDIVTNIDKEAETAIIETIKKSYPDHGFVGEEFGQQGSAESDYLWIIDPLDGTTNFVKGIPHFSVSIALKVKGKIEHAVVYDPMRNELFAASRGQGAQLNGRRIRTSNMKELSGVLLATGFPHRSKHHTEAYLNIFGALFVHSTDIRRSGSAALDLAYVAAGRHDGFWEIALKPWDTAAGILLVKEAGGLITDFIGNDNVEKTGNIVAGGPKVVQNMLKEMRPHLTESLSR
ncbi:inositol-1-monophosphatase [Algicola sagamiensis]|uniref:inositol-1-monophosphatase n=1 Tax=Algicola sagamiensis TaxID=163869 RepID=UPI0003640084|nr:inositol-1-monophosphatase [Algicola sagamiensis]